MAGCLFFFLSGFLFFFNVKTFDRTCYKNKLKRRLKTLLIPYLFWNVLAICFYLLCTSVPATATFVNIKMDIHNICDYLGITITGIVDGIPISYQFWFIRELMLAVIITPLIYVLIKYGKIYSVLLLGICWYFDFWYHIPLFKIRCIFFFSFGAFFSIYKRNLLEDFRKIKTLSFIIFPLFVASDLLTKQYEFNHYIHNINLVAGVIFCFNFVSWLMERGKIKPVPLLTSASFFVFAVHDPYFMMTIRKFGYALLKPSTDFALTSLYFVNVIIVAGISLGLYYILRKFVPKFTAVITGGR